MKKSASVPLTILATLAGVAMTGCRDRTEMQRCVDPDHRIVDDRLCDQQQRPGYHPVGPYVPYYWWYGGASGGRLGDTVVGGSNFLPSGARGVRSGEAGSGGAHGGTTRGGFGSSMGSGS